MFSMIIFFFVVSLFVWFPLVATVLWAFTFISYDVQFSWVFVAIISGVASVISALILWASTID